MTRFAIGVPNIGEYADARLLAELAREAEGAGWDGFFIWDHLFHRDALQPTVDPWVALTAVAMTTSTIRLGAMVTPISRRRPQILAKQTVSLDHLSGGRLVFGAGLGAIPAEWEGFGEDFDARVRAERLDEGLEVLAGLWSGESFSFAGKHFQVDDVALRPGTLQQPRIPIWVGGRWPNRPPMRRAARFDGVMPIKLGGGHGEPVDTEDLRELLAYIADHRPDPEAAFDVALEGRTDGGPAASREFLAPYVEAGMTWWIEGLGWWRGPLPGLRERVRQGPPQGA